MVDFKRAKSKILKNLILESLRESLDTIILGNYERQGSKLEPVSVLLPQLGYSPSNTRQLIKRGKIIAVKRKNKWLSTEELVGIFL